jgi:hypothetical protein
MSVNAPDNIIREHDMVALLRDLPEVGLVRGDAGAVVYVYENAEAFEVEFFNPAGKPRFLVETVRSKDLLKIHLQPHAHRAAS